MAHHSPFGGMGFGKLSSTNSRRFAVGGIVLIGLLYLQPWKLVRKTTFSNAAANYARESMAIYQRHFEIGCDKANASNRSDCNSISDRAAVKYQKAIALYGVLADEYSDQAATYRLFKLLCVAWGSIDLGTDRHLANIYFGKLTAEQQIEVLRDVDLKSACLSVKPSQHAKRSN